MKKYYCKTCGKEFKKRKPWSVRCDYCQENKLHKCVQCGETFVANMYNDQKCYNCIEENHKKRLVKERQRYWKKRCLETPKMKIKLSKINILSQRFSQIEITREIDYQLNHRLVLVLKTCYLKKLAEYSKIDIGLLIKWKEDGFVPLENIKQLENGINLMRKI